MCQFIVRHKIVSVLLCAAMLIAGAVVWVATARLRGQLVAHIDVARGHLEIQMVGLASAYSPEFTRILNERYGVVINRVAGCVVGPGEVEYVGGYNSVSKREVGRRFGNDVFERVADEAQRLARVRLADRSNLTSPSPSPVTAPDRSSASQPADRSVPPDPTQSRP
jgi:hypothetical protein